MRGGRKECDFHPITAPSNLPAQPPAPRHTISASEPALSAPHSDLPQARFGYSEKQQTFPLLRRHVRDGCSASRSGIHLLLFPLILKGNFLKSGSFGVARTPMGVRAEVARKEAYRNQNDLILLPVPLYAPSLAALLINSPPCAFKDEFKNT